MNNKVIKRISFDNNLWSFGTVRRLFLQKVSTSFYRKLCESKYSTNPALDLMEFMESPKFMEFMP